MAGQRLRWWWHIWPGLAQVFTGREMNGLVRATVFALLVNVGVLATFVWHGVLGAEVVRAIWLAAGAFWVGCALQTMWGHWREGSQDLVERVDSLHREALRSLARRQWDRVQELAGEALKLRPTDADVAMLMGAACLLGGDRPRALLYFDRARSTGDGKWNWEADYLAEHWGEPVRATDETETG